MTFLPLRSGRGGLQIHALVGATEGTEGGIAADRDQIEAAVKIMVAELEILESDRFGPGIAGRSVVAEQPVVEALTDSARHQPAQPQRVQPEKAMKGRP